MRIRRFSHFIGQAPGAVEMNKWTALALVLICKTAFGTVVAIDPQGFVGGTPSHYVNARPTVPEIHIIGVYDAYAPPSSRNHATGTAIVNVTGTSNVAIDLVLSSYEPTLWILQGPGAGYIHSVLINGFWASSVVGIETGNVINRSGISNYLSSCAFEWPYIGPGCETENLVRGVESIYGAPIASFTGVYSATAFTVALPSAVPEPDTASLMVIGSLFSAWVLRSRRKARLADRGTVEHGARRGR